MCFYGACETTYKAQGLCPDRVSSSLFSVRTGVVSTTRRWPPTAFVPCAVANRIAEEATRITQGRQGAKTQSQSCARVATSEAVSDLCRYSLVKQNLICALICALALTLGSLGFSVYQYVTWTDIPVENHAATIRALKFLLFIFLPGISFASSILSLYIMAALKGIARPRSE